MLNEINSELTNWLEPMTKFVGLANGYSIFGWNIHTDNLVKSNCYTLNDFTRSIDRDIMNILNFIPPLIIGKRWSTPMSF